MKFVIYWRHGDPQVVQGTTIANGCNNAGISAGAIPAIDYYSKVPSAIEHLPDDDLVTLCSVGGEASVPPQATFGNQPVFDFGKMDTIVGGKVCKP